MGTHRAVARVFAALTIAVAFIATTASPAFALGSLSVADASIAEGTGGSRSLQFVVSLSIANALPVSVDYATSDGTALAGSDYTATTGQLTIPAGQTSGTISVPLATDSLPEPNETLTLALSNPSAGTSIGDGSATGTINNDDGLPPALSVNDPSIAETDAPGTLAFTVSLTGPAAQDATFSYTTITGTASAGADFAGATGTATIPAGSSSTDVAVTVVGDDLDEADETLSLTISSPLNATVGDGTGIGTIVDDDDAPTLQSDTPSVAETDTTTALTFTVTLGAASGRTVTVDYATSDGTATAGADYNATGGTLVFSAGDTSKTVAVTVTGDQLHEPNETVTLTLSSAQNATIAQATAVGTIVDDEDAPVVSIADLAVAEGQSGTSPAQLTVSLSAPSGQSVTVDVATETGTATDGTDYEGATGTLTFPAGTTSQTFSVPVLADLVDESDETVPVVLSAPEGAVIGDGAATLTITDDDATPTLTLSDATATEGNSGNVATPLTLALSAPSGRDVSVTVATSNGTATGGADYAAQSGATITIPAGQTSAPVPTTVFGDLIDEDDETFTVALSGVTNATVSDGTGAVTIVDDDSGPTLQIGDTTQLEGSPPPATDTLFTFVITLSTASERTVSVAYATADATATAGPTNDYDQTTGTATFTPGQTTKSVTVPVNRDLHPEPAETFLVSLSAPTNAVLAEDATGVGTISNDDGPAPSLSVADASVGESAETVTVTVSLSSASTQDVSVDFTTANGTASAPSDYTASSGSVSIAAGQTSATTSVTLPGDAVDEPNETFSVTLSNARNASIGDASATITITDDDSTPSISIADVAATEGAGADVAVTLSGPSSQTITVQVTSADGTATAGQDYTTVATQATFAPGATTAQVTVSTTDDALAEGSETVSLLLSSPTGGATIDDGTGVLTIADNDAAPSLSISDASTSEGDSGTAPATFTVSLSTASTQTVTVRATATHVTTNSLDRGSLDAVLTFAPGDTSETATVTVTGDTAAEADESFTVTLSQPSGATIADGAGTGSIEDDDAAGTFTPVSPSRVLDTRDGLGRAGTSKLAAGETIVLDVTGVGGVPASGVAAVAVNVTVTEPDGAGFISVTPEGGASTSNVNHAASEDVANLVIVPVGADGSIRLLASGRTHLVADVFGWFASESAPSPGSHFTSLAPSRVLDTRTGLGVPGGSTAPAEGGVSRVLDITGAGGVPASGVTAVVLNVTVTAPTARGFLSVTPTGDFSTSNLNFVPEETVAGLVIVPVGPDGSVRYTLGFGTAHVVADVFGWFADPGSVTASVLTSVEPSRLADTRDYPGSPLGPQESGILPIAGEGGVPETGVESAVINLTVDQPTAPSYLAATPDGAPGTSNLNFVAGQTVANLAIVPLLPEDGAIDIFNFAGEVHVIVDVFAWFSTPAP